MDIRLKEKPQGCTIIEGFPGLGLIGTISTEYLIRHLDAKPIGYIWSKDINPVATVHDSKVIQPFEIYYVKKKNLIIVHAMIDARGLEWEIADTLIQLYKILKAKEIISLEGILGQGNQKKTSTYYFSNSSAIMKKLGKASGEKLKEGIIMGVTAAILLRDKMIKTTGVFVETHSKLPDSRAAAQIVKFLDEYLDLKVEYKPLEAAAKEFESKMKDYVGKLEKTQKAAEEGKPTRSLKHADYMG